MKKIFPVVRLQSYSVCKKPKTYFKTLKLILWIIDVNNYCIIKFKTQRPSFASMCKRLSTWFPSISRTIVFIRDVSKIAVHNVRNSCTNLCIFSNFILYQFEVLSLHIFSWVPYWIISKIIASRIYKPFR